MRKLRSKQNGKEHLLKNLSAKKGMKLLRKEGRLMSFNERTSIRKDTRLEKNLNDWDWYRRGSRTQADILETKKPDIVSQLNEKWRTLQEEEDTKYKKMLEDEKMVEDEKMEGLDYEDTFCFEAPTEEDNEMFEKFRQKEMDDLIKDKKERLKAKNEEAKKARNIPLDALPERPLSEYEMIRKANIKARETAMIEAGFYKDLEKCKKSIGFVENIKNKD